MHVPLPCFLKPYFSDSFQWTTLATLSNVYTPSLLVETSCNKMCHCFICYTLESTKWRHISKYSFLDAGCAQCMILCWENFAFCLLFQVLFFQVSASAFGCFVPYIVSVLVFRSNHSKFAFVKSIIPAPYLHSDTACELVALIMFFVNLIGIHSMQDWTTTLGMELQEKEAQKDYSISLLQEICLERTHR